MSTGSRSERDDPGPIDQGHASSRRGRGRGRGPRADAVRNRQRVVESAHAVFTQRGTEVGMREVAAHAGVGLATIYRHFADKDALVLAVVEDRFRQIAGQARDAMDTLEAWPAFVRMMRRMAEMMTEDRALAGAISAARRSRPADGASEGGGDPTGEARAEMDAALSELAERAKAAGELREDVGPLELGLVVGGVAMSLDMAREVRDPPPWERFLEVALDGLREASRGAAGR